MQADFHDAHERHLKDAEDLYQGARWANADHLFGFAAECGLKRLMLIFGMPVNTGGSPAGDHDRRHAEQIWQRYETYRSGHAAGARYILAQTNPFMNWHATQRYAHQGNFDEARVTPHRLAAQQVNGLLRQARMDGLI